MGLLHQSHYLAERLADGLRRKTAQPVVSAQLNQHPARVMLLQQSRQASQTLRRRITADACVDNIRQATTLFPLIIQ